MAGNQAEVAVVVATRNRATKLERLLRSLDAERAHPSTPAFEVVVVDDASTDSTAAVLDAFARGSDLALRHLRQDRQAGPAAARNRGWRATTAPKVCFTDDDCIVRPGWVAGLAGALDSVDVAQGRTVPTDGVHIGPFSHTMDVPAHDLHYPTCNMAYRRSALEAVGGFDERFEVPYGEDTDLAWRAIEAGASVSFVDDAVIEHEVRPGSVRSHLADLRRRQGIVTAIHKHPRIRDHLAKRGYVRPGHGAAGLLVAALAVAAAAPSPVTAVALVGAGGSYAWRCRRVRRRPARRYHWIGVVPLAFLADLYEISVLARASVRHRTLVL